GAVSLDINVVSIYGCEISGGLPIQNYNVYRAASSSGPWTDKLGAAGATPPLKYTDTTAHAGNTYYYAVTATDTGQNVSPVSVPPEVTMPSLPAAPYNVQAVPNSAANITVSWHETVPVPPNLPISLLGNAFTIYRGLSPTFSTMTKLTSRSASPFTDTGAAPNTLSPNTTYYYAITATDTGGDTSLPSTPAAQ